MLNDKTLEIGIVVKIDNLKLFLFLQICQTATFGDKSVAFVHRSRHWSNFPLLEVDSMVARK